MTTQNPKTLTKRITHCAICQYELTNQPTTYIQDYHLIAVRCPECGQQQPAGITTQPWRYRKLKYAFMLTLWVLLLFTTVFSVPIALSSMAHSTAYASLKPFAEHITALQAQSDSKYHAARWDRTLNPRYEINQDWWNNLGNQLAIDTFDPSKHIDWIVFTDWLWFFLIAPAVALLYYALLYRAHWATKLVVILPSLFIAAVSTSLVLWPIRTVDFQMTPAVCAIEVAGQPIGWSTFAVGTISILIAYALAPRLIKALRKPFGNVPTDPNTL